MLTFHKDRHILFALLVCGEVGSTYDFDIITYISVFRHQSRYDV